MNEEVVVNLQFAIAADDQPCEQRDLHDTHWRGKDWDGNYWILNVAHAIIHGWTLPVVKSVPSASSIILPGNEGSSGKCSEELDHHQLMEEEELMAEVILLTQRGSLPFRKFENQARTGFVMKPSASLWRDSRARV